MAGAAAAAAAALSQAASQAVLASMSGPYKRVAGLHSSYQTLHVPTAEDLAAASLASRRMPAGVRMGVTWAPGVTAASSTDTLGATAVAPSSASPSGVTTVSARELRESMRRNVGPRHDPRDRFGTPLTASQEVGWRAHEPWVLNKRAVSATAAAERGVLSDSVRNNLSSTSK